MERRVPAEGVFSMIGTKRKYKEGTLDVVASLIQETSGYEEEFS
jgi:hypothetical protein